jgi:hypothetical protein
MQKILSPWEVDKLVQQIIDGSAVKALPLSEQYQLAQSMQRFMSRWAETYAQFGENLSGELAYRDIILYFTQQCLPKLRAQLSEDGEDQQAVSAIESMLSPGLAPKQAFKFPIQNFKIPPRLPEAFACPLFDRPLFIVSAPRAGSTLLFETLSKFEEIWTIGQESHKIEKDISYIHPASHGYASNRLQDAPLEVCNEVRHWFARRLQNRDKKAYLKMDEPPDTLRFLEKTPKNALRIPFLKKVFPDALFVFLYREPLANISSLLEGWRSNRFLAYQDLPRWPYKEWHFLLPPGWEGLVDKPLAEIAACQWCAANQYILDDLTVLPETEWCLVIYDDLVAKPADTIAKISRFAGFNQDRVQQQRISESLPLSSMVISPPAQEKWRQHEAELLPILSLVEPISRQVLALKARLATC